MTLILSSNHLQTIYAQATAAYPEECCGLLLGRATQESPASRQVLAVMPVRNAWSPEVMEMVASGTESSSTSKANRYWIDPAEMLAGQRQARDRQMAIIGIYHSHPDHPAIPSECDRSLAWSGYSYLIISVSQGIPQNLLSWRLDEHHQFQAEAVVAASPASDADLDGML